DYVCQVGTRKSGRTACNDAYVHRLIKRDLPCVNLQNAFSAANVRPSDHDAAVKASRTQKCRVENVGPVGRSHQNDAVVRFKAVHLDQQLVERLFALIVSAAESRTAVSADSVDLVNKDDARCVLLALFKQVADA